MTVRIVVASNQLVNCLNLLLPPNALIEAVFQMGADDRIRVPADQYCQQGHRVRDYRQEVTERLRFRLSDNGLKWCFRKSDRSTNVQAFSQMQI